MQPIQHLRRNAVAYVALFVALGGTSYAAASLPANSVGPRQLKAGAVTSRAVKDGSLLGRDFKAGQLPAGPQGAQGPQGAPGPQGPQGPKGDTGTVDTSQFYDKTASDDRYYTKQNADDRFFTKADSDGRYWTKGDADGRYKQNCQRGTITGYAQVNGSSTFSSSPTTDGVRAWNCTGEAVKVLRRGTGEYDVVFYGQDYMIQTGIASADYYGPGVSTQVSGAYQIGYGDDSNGHWPYPTVGIMVRVRNAAGALVDAPFQVAAVPRY